MICKFCVHYDKAGEKMYCKVTNEFVYQDKGACEKFIDRWVKR